MSRPPVTQRGGPEAPGFAGRQLYGHTRVSTQALTSLARAAASRVLGVPAQDVRIYWADDGGLLALSIVSPVLAPPLATVARDADRLDGYGGSILNRVVAAKADIFRSVTALSGAQLSRVDIRVSGVKISDGGRVR